MDLALDKLSILDERYISPIPVAGLTVAGEFEEHSKEIIEEYSNLLHLIFISVAPVSIKIEALEVIALSKIVHHFANTRFNEDQLNELDTLLTKTICSILCLNHSIIQC